MNFKASDVKPGAVYGSRFNGRLWRWDGETMWTKGEFDVIWHECGWPHPTMERRDIAYYLSIGYMHELVDSTFC